MNPVVHFELPYKVGIRVQRFYQEVFGWQTECLGPKMGNYILATTALSDVKSGAPAGAINGGFFPFKPNWPDQCPSFVIGVENIEESMKKVIEMGGQVLGEPYEIPRTGLYVSFKDTEGNRVSLLQPKEMTT